MAPIVGDRLVREDENMQEFVNETGKTAWQPVFFAPTPETSDSGVDILLKIHCDGAAE